MSYAGLAVIERELAMVKHKWMNRPWCYRLSPMRWIIEGTEDRWRLAILPNASRLREEVVVKVFDPSRRRLISLVRVVKISD